MRETINVSDKIVWMHCSSLGEFEQGRPLLEKIKSHFPSYKILLTFFSPSGYEVRKDYAGADYIFYLPSDSKKNAAQFYDIVKPQLIVFVKYEFWYYYLSGAKRRNIPLLLISAIFRKSQPFFLNYGSFHRSMLTCFTHLFVQNNQSIGLLNTIGYTENVTLSGDTRFDRVIEIAESFQPIASVENFCQGSNVIVAGSTWSEDDRELAHYVNSKSALKFIIAPHDISKERLQECLKLYKNSTLFSALNSTLPPTKINTIIIDNIGMLSRLYKYATIAYVGGGFGADGVHNVLEAAVYGKPVIYGPEYSKFNEAIELVESGGGISIKNGLELETTLDTLLKNNEKYAEKAQSALQYVYSKKGSTEKILQFIYENRLLTN
ncbi:3-deoxy-D-manno-octulosonic acid transferase [Segetibacter aerophilus]|uniref:3-deoxy-D-manno-octulosonic acid transferase n=2 Tax=Segetibacter aerophilus TaxID=670293 RepID=A0A512BBH1_9BACT|nr:3-deoxy-D-manno-octulosonic acid transferase [Segetibacter aerophilus]